MNPEQHEAVALALSARDVWSTAALLAAVQTRRLPRRAHCTATSASRVDLPVPGGPCTSATLELCVDAGLAALRVGHPARVLPRLQAHTL